MMTIEELKQWLKNLASKAKNIPPKFYNKLITNVLYQSTKKIFESKGNVLSPIIAYPPSTPTNALGRTWAPYSPATLNIFKNRKRSRGSKPQMLRDTGVLYNSITTYEKTDGLEYGTELVYAPIHQFGGNVKVFGKGRGVMPSRPFVFLTENDYEKMSKILNDLIDGAING